MGVFHSLGRNGDMSIDNAFTIRYTSLMRHSIKNPRRWGHWHLLRDTWVLRYVDPKWDAHFYEVDLERIHTSASMLDWIFQVRGLIFVSSKDLGDLIEALNWIFHPQAELCGGCLGSIRHGNIIKPLELLEKLPPDPILPPDSPSCAHCGNVFAPTREWQRYCSRTCKNVSAYQRRFQASEG